MWVALSLVLLLSPPEAAHQPPLLVVVEAHAREAVEASALRDAIAREPGLQVLSPAEDPGYERNYLGAASVGLRCPLH
jgi:hypothetical protein